MIVNERNIQIPQSPSTPTVIKNESNKRNIDDEEDELLLTQIAKKL
jgi:hypothetical protein